MATNTRAPSRWLCLHNLAVETISFYIYKSMHRCCLHARAGQSNVLPSFSSPCPGSKYALAPPIFSRIQAPGLPNGPSCSGLNCSPMFPSSFSNPSEDTCAWKGKPVVYTVQTPVQKSRIVPCVVSDLDDVSRCTLPNFKIIKVSHTGNDLRSWLNQNCQIMASQDGGFSAVC